jgi:Mg-chelatase subunit ChlD
MMIALSFLYPAFLWLLGLIPLFLGLGWPERHAPDRRQRWLGLALRLLVLLGLILALAGAQLERPVDTITTVFVLDASDSISVADRTQAEAFLREALAQKPEDDQAAVILFGGDALVERLPRPETTLPTLASTPIKNATNIEDALRLALALLPNEGGRRIVLLSDGQETEGEARRLLDLAVARQVEISVYPLGTVDSAEPEVLVESVAAPAQARQGQAVPVEVVVTANQAAEANLRLLADGVLVESRAVRLVRGRNRFEFNLPVSEAGFHRFRAEIEAAADGRLQNNWGAAFTTVYGPPQLLLVEGQPGEAAALSAALKAAGLESKLIAPTGLPGTLPGLAAYDAIILANVPATALPQATQEALVSFVRDLGRGLVMVGGPESYGAGGYLRSPLEKAMPVDMEVRNRSREPNIALVLAVDKSGSMGACHCDDPNSRPQQQARVPSGLPKIDIAKEAIFQASAVLGELDYLGVVSFDNSAHWQLEPSPGVDLNALEQAIGGIAANGQTNIYAGLVAAEESLATIPARLKHIILLTDGWSNSGAYEELTTRLANKGITLSVVGAGGGSATYLAELARQGGGQYYPATTMSEVPQIFLKETVRAVGNYIVEEPFLPVSTLGADGGLTSPILHGLDLVEVPPLLGYNGTTPKTAARIALLTPRGDPLLATWQYGLGRSVAWTSDLSGRWAKNWLEWAEFSRFVGQMVNWSLPRPGDEQLDLSVSVSGNQATLSAIVGGNGAAVPQLNITAKLLAAGGEVIETELQPSGPNRYQATVPLPAEGIYLAQVTAYAQSSANAAENSEPVANQTTGLVAPYSAEYANLNADLTLLTGLPIATGGQTLRDPAQAFAHNLAIGRQTWPIWPTLLLLAALLFPLDVAIRRLRLGRREWRQAQAWLSRRLPGFQPASTNLEPPQTPASPTVQAFRQAQQRVRSQPAAPPPSAASGAEPVKSREPASSVSAEPPPPSLASDQDTLARLRAAKKRVRRS